MTDIERAAQALYEHDDWLNIDTEWAEVGETIKTRYRERATAVIESALLDPSKEVVEAVARRLCIERGIRPDEPVFSGPIASPRVIQPTWHTWRDEARAALRAAGLAILGREGSADG